MNRSTHLKIAKLPVYTSGIRNIISKEEIDQIIQIPIWIRHDINGETKIPGTEPTVLVLAYRKHKEKFRMKEIQGRYYLQISPTTWYYTWKTEEQRKTMEPNNA